ncbi:MAG: hypothetical protein AB7N76_18595 [Planctomycetota bacterium]
MKEPPSPANQYGMFTAGGARQALEALRKNRAGALMVTSGHQDVRLVLEARRIGVEVAGWEVDGDEEAWGLVRAFLCSLFWGEATYFLQLDGRPREGALAIRVEANVQRVLETIDEGVRELTSLREQVPGLDVLVQGNGEAPPEDADSCAANLFRALGDQARHLGMAAEDAGLDPIDAAWGVADLLEAEQAGIRRAPPTMAARRLRSAEALASEGLLPAVRHLHLARGFQRADPPRSARHLLDAGSGFLGLGMHKDALSAFTAALEVLPRDTGALEGILAATEGSGDKDEARRIREQLIELYRGWRLPSRVLRHLDALGNLNPQQRQLRLDCLLEQRDFGAALEFARTLVGGMRAEERFDLARRFCEAGVDGAQRERVLSLAGVHRLRWPRRLLMLASLLLLAAGGLAATEVYLRMRFGQASRLTRFSLDQGDFSDLAGPWAELRSLSAQAGAQLPRGLALREVEAVREELDLLAQDHELVGTPAARRALDWKAWPSVFEAKAALTSLGKSARTEALKKLVAAKVAEVDGYLDKVKAELGEFRGLTNPASKLEKGLELLRKHPAARELFEGDEVEVELDVIPALKGLEVQWTPDGGEAGPAAQRKESRYAVRFKLRPGAAGEVLISAPQHLPQKRRIELKQGVPPIVGFELVRTEDLNGRIKHPTERGLTLSSERLVLLPEELATRELQRAGIKDTDVESSAADLAFLADGLAEGERLYVELLNAVEPSRPPRVYLSGIRFWLDKHLDSGGERKSKGRLIEFNALLRGLNRNFTASGSQGTLPSLSKANGFERVGPAAVQAIQMERGQ